MKKETEHHRPPAAHTPEEAEPGPCWPSQQCRGSRRPRPQGRPDPPPGAQDPIPGPVPPGPVSTGQLTVATCSPAATWGPWPHTSQLLPQLLQLLHGDLGGCGRGTDWRCCWLPRLGRKLCSLLGVLLHLPRVWKHGALASRWPHTALPPSRSSALQVLQLQPSTSRAGTPRAARPQVTRTGPHTHFPWLGLFSAGGWPPCCARPHPFKGPGMGLPGVLNRPWAPVTREEALAGPAPWGHNSTLPSACTSQCHK